MNCTARRADDPLRGPERVVAEVPREIPSGPPDVAPPWGPEEKLLRLSRGLGVGFRGLSRLQAEALGGLEDGSSPSGGAGQLAVTVRRAVEQQRGRLVSDRVVALRWQTGERELEIAGRHFFASIVRQPAGTFAADLWTFWESAGEFNDAVSNFTRVAIALGWTSARRLLVHSCAVAATGGRIGLFFGRSDAGKSTLGALAVRAGRRVLSDDLNSVDLGDPDRVTVQAFPWTGDHGPRSWSDVRTGELGAIFKLEQAARHELAPLAPARAIAGLASCAPFVNAEPSLYERLLPVLEELVARVPVLTLRFKKDEGLWALVDEVLEARP